jgi:hypothetical protein
MPKFYWPKKPIVDYSHFDIDLVCYYFAGANWRSWLYLLPVLNEARPSPFHH